MQLVNELKDLLKEKQYSIANAAKAMDISSTTLHLWMNKKYKGNIQKVEDSVKHFLEIEKLREGKVKLGFVNTTIVEDIFDIAKTCHVENEIGVCCGDAGIGKTFAVKKYAIDNSDVILVEADLGYTPKVLFSEIPKKRWVRLLYPLVVIQITKPNNFSMREFPFFLFSNKAI